MAAAKANVPHDGDTRADNLPWDDPIGGSQEPAGKPRYRSPEGTYEVILKSVWEDTRMSSDALKVILSIAGKPEFKNGGSRWDVNARAIARDLDGPGGRRWTESRVRRALTELRRLGYLAVEAPERKPDGTYSRRASVLRRDLVIKDEKAAGKDKTAGHIQRAESGGVDAALTPKPLPAETPSAGASSQVTSSAQNLRSGAELRVQGIVPGHIQRAESARLSDYVVGSDYGEDLANAREAEPGQAPDEPGLRPASKDQNLRGAPPRPAAAPAPAPAGRVITITPEMAASDYCVACSRPAQAIKVPYIPVPFRFCCQRHPDFRGRKGSEVFVWDSGV